MKIEKGLSLRAANGERMIIDDTRESSNGTLMSFESFIPIGGKPLQHYHPYQEEKMIVMEGKAGVVIGSVPAYYTPGQVLIIPKGTPHTIWAEDKQQLHARFEFRPALHSQEYFVQSMHIKNAFQHGALLNRHKDEIRMRFPMSVVMTLLGWIGKWMGY